MNTAEREKILQSAKCREILKEIMDFGVNQHQIKTLIKLLALELDDRKMMKDIREAVEGSTKSNIII